MRMDGYLRLQLRVRLVIDYLDTGGRKSRDTVPLRLYKVLHGFSLQLSFKKAIGQESVLEHCVLFLFTILL